MRRIVPALCVLLLTASLAAAADWPGWRGPNRDGKSPDTGLLKEWPDDGPKLLWKVDGIGDGFSSVAVVGGKVYITGDKDGKLTIFAFDLDGKPQWKVEHGQRPRRARRLPRHAGDRRRQPLSARRQRPGRLLRRQDRPEEMVARSQGVRRLAGRMGLCRVGADLQEPGDLQARRQELHRRPGQDHRRDRLEEHRLRRRAGVRLLPRP